MGTSVYCSFIESPIHGVRTEWALDPSPERVNAEKTLSLISILDKRIIPVPDETELWGPEGRLDINMTFLFTESARMLSLICPDRFVRGDHSTGNADSHLRAQPERFPTCLIRCFLYNVHNLRHMYRQQNKPSMYQTKAVCPKVLGKSAVLQSMSAAWDTSFFDYIIAHMFEK